MPSLPETSGRPVQNVLIVGITGRMGLACLEKFANLEDDECPRIHGFCRDKRKLQAAHMNLLDSVVEGNAKSSRDLEQAISLCNADVIILAVGNDKASNVRAANARATVKALARIEGLIHESSGALSQTGSLSFYHKMAAVTALHYHHSRGPANRKSQVNNIRVIAISRLGAGGSRIRPRLVPVLGRFYERRLRYILEDHNEQEKALRYDPYCQHRTTILRFANVKQGQPSSHVIEFGNKDKAPSLTIDREDLAKYVVLETLRGGHAGDAINVTGVKNRD